MENAEARRRFDEQFSRCYRYIFRYIVALVPNHADADDVFQETSLAILQSWQDYDSTRPMVPWACGSHATSCAIFTIAAAAGHS